jgi:hypothetical protein
VLFYWEAHARAVIIIADLLDRDFSVPVEEFVKVNNDDPDTVFTELSEYVATEAIKAAYEGLFSALAAASKTPGEGVGIWISGPLGSGKSLFAKNLVYVLANREVLGSPASSLFLSQVDSEQVAKNVEFLNRAFPYEIFVLDVPADLPAQTSVEQIAEVMYRVLLRHLDYSEDRDISELEIALEKEGKLASFEDLCRAEYRQEWQEIRRGGQKFIRSSALLHRLDPQNYAAADTWLNRVKGQDSRKLIVQELVEKSFDLCEIRRPGRAFAFVLDEMDQYIECLRAIVEEFGREGVQRVKAGKIPDPAWIIVTAQQKLPEVPQLQACFQHQIHLSLAGIREVAVRRVLRKKESHEPVLRKLFRDCGASLIQNVALERCSRRTGFDEDQFVQYCPYLPHLIDFSMDVVAGILRHGKHLTGGNRSIVKQSFEMLVSERTRLADQPVGALVSIDKIYELVEENIPTEKQKVILEIRRRFERDPDYPEMAGRVAKAICLMEFAGTDLPVTMKNIAALLVQHAAEAPPLLAVDAILFRLKEAQFVRQIEDTWKLHDFDELRRAVAALEGPRNAVGTVNPRPPGWHNDLIQLAKKSAVRMLAWYTQPSREFDAIVSRSLDEIVWALDHLSMDLADHVYCNMVDLERLSMDLVALEERLAHSEKTNVILQDQIRTLVGSRKIDIGAQTRRTAYVIGLFGSGRRYINELILQNIGERAKYFRDTIRFHPGPTPMIYSGHATMKHISRAQELPVVMSRILEAAEAGFADLIFVYRHPLDSLLTNWVWWRTFIRGKSISGISEVYETTDDLCADLEQQFTEFRAFAEGNPDFFAGASGRRFLSFSEFVEETELHLQSATLALRLEDFTTDPYREFSKIVEVLSADVDVTNLDVTNLCIARPRTKPYGYLTVQEKVPRFKKFIAGLNAETRRRIEKIGYGVRVS